MGASLCALVVASAAFCVARTTPWDDCHAIGSTDNARRIAVTAGDRRIANQGLFRATYDAAETIRMLKCGAKQHGWRGEAFRRYLRVLREEAADD